jgi:hypothetical protein
MSEVDVCERDNRGLCSKFAAVFAVFMAYAGYAISRQRAVECASATLTTKLSFSTDYLPQIVRPRIHRMIRIARLNRTGIRGSHPFLSNG